MQTTDSACYLLVSHKENNGQYLIKAIPLVCYEEQFKKTSQFPVRTSYPVGAKLAPSGGCAWAPQIQLCASPTQLLLLQSSMVNGAFEQPKQ